MSKVNKISKTLLGVVVTVVIIVAALVVVANIVAPSIVKSYVENHDRELLGRRVTVDDIELNLFSGKAVVNGVRVYETDDTTEWASFNEFYADIRMYKLLSKMVVADSIRLSGLKVNLIQDGSNFNFSDIIERFSTPDTLPADTTPSSWGVILNNIRIDKSVIHYTDAQVGSYFGLTDFSLQIPNINLADIKSKMGLHLEFVNGGSLDTRLIVDANKRLYNLWFDLTDFHLNAAHPYIRQFVNSNTLSGTMTTRLNIKGKTDHILDLSIGGQIGIKEFALTDLENRTVAVFDTVGIEAANIYFKNRSAMLNTLYLSGLKLGYTIYNDTLSNFTGFLVDRSESDTLQAEATEAEDDRPWVVTAKSVKADKIEFTYTDKTLVEPFEFRIHDITASVTGYDSRRRNSVRVNAHLQDRGSMRAEWNGSLSDFANQSLNVKISNLPLETFSPYALDYTAYPLKSGTITIDDRTTITNNYINSNNKLLIYHPEAGEKDASVYPKLKIPLKTCLYLLTDMNNTIDFKLPVTGNIKSPKFSYRKIVVKAIFNAMLKVLASPVNAIAKSLAGNNVNISDMLIELNQFELTADQYGQLDAMAALLNAKPELRMVLRQSINYQKGLEGMSLWELRRDYLKSNGNENPTLKEMQRVDVNSKNVKIFLWDRVKKSGIGYNADVTTDAISLYGDKMSRLILRGVAVRDSLVESYFSRIGVPDSCYEVVKLSPDSIKSSRGSNKFMVTFDVLKNEEVETVEEVSKVIDERR